MNIEKKACELFEKMQSVFGYDSAMRERDIKTIAEAFIDVSIDAIIADDRPVGPQDESFVALADKGIEEGRRRVALNKLKRLSARPHSHKFWEISSVADEAVSLLSFDNKAEVGNLERNPVTLRWWCQKLLDIIENYDISHDASEEEMALLNDIGAAVDPTSSQKYSGTETGVSA